MLVKVKKIYVYHYCAMYYKEQTQTYKNGFFESDNIGSSNNALKIQDEIKKALGQEGEESFVLISFSKIGIKKK